MLGEVGAVKTASHMAVSKRAKITCIQPAVSFSNFVAVPPHLPLSPKAHAMRWLCGVAVSNIKGIAIVFFGTTNNRRGQTATSSAGALLRPRGERR